MPLTTEPTIDDELDRLDEEVNAARDLMHAGFHQLQHDLSALRERAEMLHEQARSYTELIRRAAALERLHGR